MDTETRRRRGRRKGSVMMETVIVMPILLFLVFMIIQIAHLWMARQMVAYAAFCGARAIMTVKPGEQQDAASNAAKMALSWMCLANEYVEGVAVPGWGTVTGAGSVDARVTAEIVDGLNGSDDSSPVAGVKVSFKFPALISGMAVNKFVANAAKGRIPAMSTKTNFYEDLAAATVDVDEIDGWPYVELTETCVLPMPYSTGDFPSGGYSGCSLK